MSERFFFRRPSCRKFLRTDKHPSLWWRTCVVAHTTGSEILALCGYQPPPLPILGDLARGPFSSKGVLPICLVVWLFGSPGLARQERRCIHVELSAPCLERRREKPLSSPAQTTTQTRAHTHVHTHTHTNSVWHTHPYTHICFQSQLYRVCVCVFVCVWAWDSLADLSANNNIITVICTC